VHTAPLATVFLLEVNTTFRVLEVLTFGADFLQYSFFFPSAKMIILSPPLQLFFLLFKSNLEQENLMDEQLGPVL